MCVSHMPVEDSVGTSNNSSQVVWQQLQCFYNDWTESHHMSKLCHTSYQEHQPTETPACEPKSMKNNE